MRSHGPPSACSSARSTAQREDYADDAELELATDDALDAASLLFREPNADEQALLVENERLGCCRRRTA